MYYHKLEVSGTGRFPVDMLRYDSCFPVDHIAVDVLCVGQHQDGWTCKVGQYTPTKQHRFTVDRWKSFGCTVDERTITTLKV